VEFPIIVGGEFRLQPALPDEVAGTDHEGVEDELEEAGRVEGEGELWPF
jgi:hypothetical protein